MVRVRLTSRGWRFAAMLGTGAFLGGCTADGALAPAAGRRLDSIMGNLGSAVGSRVGGPAMRGLGRDAGRLLGSSVVASLSAREQRQVDQARLAALENTPPVRRAIYNPNPPPPPPSVFRQPGAGAPQPTPPARAPGVGTGSRPGVERLNPADSAPPASPAATPAGPAYTWESTENPGTRGTSVVTGDSIDPAGRRCRQIATLVIRDGQEERVSETLCRDPQRGWVPTA